jgi:ribulose 1,5-bisphosphate synthetase/thiazole synthase
MVNGVNPTAEMEDGMQPNAQHTDSESDHGRSYDYDVIIIGAGIVGAMVARTLSRYDLDILWIETADTPPSPARSRRR